MKTFKLVLLFFCTFFIFTNVDACTAKEKELLRAETSQIKFDYDIYLENNKPLVYFSFYNFNDLFYIKERPYNNEFHYNNESTITKYGYKDGVNYQFVIYGSNNSACPDTIILDKYIGVAKYNKYYENKLCDGIKEFTLCGKYNDLDMDEEEFTRRVNEYKEKLNKKEEPVINPTKKENKLLQFLIDNWVYLASGAVILVVVVGGIINVKKKK